VTRTRKVFIAKNCRINLKRVRRTKRIGTRDSYNWTLLISKRKLRMLPGLRRSLQIVLDLQMKYSQHALWIKPPITNLG